MFAINSLHILVVSEILYEIGLHIPRTLLQETNVFRANIFNYL